METVINESIIFIFIFIFLLISFFIILIIHIIIEYILPIIKYFLDDCSAIKKELIKIGVTNAEFTEFKRIKIYTEIYKSSIELTIDNDNNIKPFQYIDFWNISPDCKIIFALYQKNDNTIYRKRLNEYK